MRTILIGSIAALVCFASAVSTANGQTDGQTQSRATCLAAQQAEMAARANCLDARTEMVAFHRDALAARAECTDPAMLAVGDWFLFEGIADARVADDTYGAGLEKHVVGVVETASGNADWAANRWTTAAGHYELGTASWLLAIVRFGSAGEYYASARGSFSGAIFAYGAGVPAID